MLTRIRNRFNEAIWQPELDELAAPKRWGVTAVRIVQILVRDFQNDGMVQVW